jgi:DoxX-like family
MNSRITIWAGRLISTLVVVGFVMSGAMKIMKHDEVAKDFVGTFGFPAKYLVVLAAVELLSALLYALPWTSVLGAVLLTGYLGGAIATHLRVNDPMFIAPAVLGVLVWLGLFFRDARIRALLPIRRQQSIIGDP